MTRLQIFVRGLVQGVGFRPFVHRLATGAGLAGHVANTGDGVRIEIEGPSALVRTFVRDLRLFAPPAASIDSIETRSALPVLERSFEIRSSAGEGPLAPSLSPDLAPCPACLAEVLSPTSRRRDYPFTSCADCGPRWSIATGLPWDRSRTTMAGFSLCAACRAEYSDPADRRFHAEAIACPACGPALELVDAAGFLLAPPGEALARATEAILAGRILALRGVGGFQLLADATAEEAIASLRSRKRRPSKPFAVLFASIAEVELAAHPSPAETAALGSPTAPIVLVARRPGPSGLAASVAPATPLLGAMLPASPLHHLLARRAGRPLVCTSGNRSDEPIAVDLPEALDRLGDVADLFLSHDRPIVRPLDDPVTRAGAVLRRARGHAPRPLRVDRDLPPILALGADEKNAVAIAVRREIVPSQHLGDLDDPRARRLQERTARELVDLLQIRPEIVACDLHPDHASTALAESLATGWGVRLERVQHHHAHVAAVMAEHCLAGPVLGLAWDGTGFGPDGTVWGGEALVVDGAGFRRIAHLAPFRLPGGEAAIREPRRVAASLLAATGRPVDRGLASLVATGVGSPWTTSIGRLFDAVASLCGLCHVNEFEGQAAAALEHALESTGDPYPLPLGSGDPALLDWRPLLEEILADRAAGALVSRISGRFHEALARAGLEIARRAGLPDVALGGGCFQNRHLVDRLRTLLEADGFRVHVPRLLPPGDGGIAVGQVLVAAGRG